MTSLAQRVLAGLASRLRESPWRTLGALAALSVVSTVEYFPQAFPRWLYVTVIASVIIVLVVLCWPLLSIGRSGRKAIAERERALREAEANPLAAPHRERHE